MKLFIVCNDDLSIEAGGIIHIFETFDPIAGKGNQVTLYAPDKGRFKRKSKIVIRYIFSPFKGPLGVLAFNFSLLISLIADVKKNKPHIIYTRQLSYSFVPLLVAFLFRIKHCLEVNGVLYDELKIIKASKFRLKIVKWIAYVNCRFSDGISVTVKETAERVCEIYQAPMNKITIVPCNAANHYLFQPQKQSDARKRLSFSQDEFIIGFIGSLYGWRGIDLLIRSLPGMLFKIPKIKLLIVGCGVELENLKVLAKELKIDKFVLFTGIVPYELVPTYIHTFDAGISFFKFVRPIPGIPMKMYEYMACGKAVIATNISGYGHVLADEHAGISVDSNNVEEIATAAIKLYQHPELRITMGENGRKAVVREFNWEKVSVKAEDFIKKTLFV